MIFMHLNTVPLRIEREDSYIWSRILVITPTRRELNVLGACVHLKGIGVSSSALSGPQRDYISQYYLSFATATAITASLQIHNRPVLISSRRLQMWMAGINHPYFDGLHITDDRCGHYSRLRRSLRPCHDHSNLRDDWYLYRHRLSAGGWTLYMYWR